MNTSQSKLSKLATSASARKSPKANRVRFTLASDWPKGNLFFVWLVTIGNQINFQYTQSIFFQIGYSRETWRHLKSLQKAARMKLPWWRYGNRFLFSWCYMLTLPYHVLLCFQLEERAMEELLQHYGGKDNACELIIVERIPSTTAKPVWKKERSPSLTSS